MTELSEVMAATSASQYSQVHSWAIPSIQCVHIMALAVLFSSALMVDLRVLGTGLRTQSLQVVAARFLPPIWVCLVVLLISGGALILAEPGRTISNPVFYTKMSLLVAAIIVTLWLRAFAKGSRPTAALQVVLALVSLLLWSAIIVAGRYIAYVESF